MTRSIALKKPSQMVNVAIKLVKVASTSELFVHFMLGYLGSSVKVYGDWLPRQLFGRFTAFFAILRMIYLALIAVIFYRASTDIVILDGVSAPIPILKLFGMKVLFYCHFPDLVSIRAFACLRFKLRRFLFPNSCYATSAVASLRSSIGTCWMALKNGQLVVRIKSS